jgi:hypothetical protein
MFMNTFYLQTLVYTSSNFLRVAHGPRAQKGFQLKARL